MDENEENVESCRFYPDLDIDPAISGLPIPEFPTITHRMINIPSSQLIIEAGAASPKDDSNCNQVSQYFETITSSKNEQEEVKNEFFIN